MNHTRLLRFSTIRTVLDSKKGPNNKTEVFEDMRIVGLVRHQRSGCGSAQFAADCVRRFRPAAVMLEIDKDRYSIAVNSINTKTPMNRPGRCDLISSIHGGLMCQELLSVINTCKEINTKIFVCDRPHRITQNRMGKLLLNPVQLGKLFQFACRSIMYTRQLTRVHSDHQRLDGSLIDNDLLDFLRKNCKYIYRILIEERVDYMSHLIFHHHISMKDIETDNTEQIVSYENLRNCNSDNFKVASNDDGISDSLLPLRGSLVICSELQAEELTKTLQGIVYDPVRDEALKELKKKVALANKNYMPLWPIIIVLYFALPLSAIILLVVWLTGTIFDILGRIRRKEAN